ncbi:MAG TPA: FkbM family methyltransferase [Verrucomicrobiae bacterium]|jgi:FkbM family methyltransferase|nr:FkbM family methyltransferase [Verrucomicrobiae bacterium]
MGQQRRISSFLYRRLARWITCEVQLLGEHRLALNNKFQVNSLQDVFCHPFYWQLFGWIPQPPSLVVDLGAHCGHFSMLADVCFETQFGSCQPQYVMVEPNPKLSQVIRSNLAQSGLCRRHSIFEGLVGSKRAGFDDLWVCPSNFLSASLVKGPGTHALKAEYVDLDAAIPPGNIDLLKVDIEGAEYELLDSYPTLLDRVSRVMIEVHERPGSGPEAIFGTLQAAGLRIKGSPLKNGSATLAMYERTSNGQHG